jgi:hypothetical protein
MVERDMAGYYERNKCFVLMTVTMTVNVTLTVTVSMIMTVPCTVSLHV